MRCGVGLPESMHLSYRLVCSNPWLAGGRTMASVVTERDRGAPKSPSLEKESGWPHV